MPTLTFEIIAGMVGTEELTNGAKVRSFAITANVA
jgi:hypothetical protein